MQAVPRQPAGGWRRISRPVEGGARAGVAAAFQLRVKDVDEHALARLAEPLQRICADAEVTFIVNDSMALARRLGADGVHLGQSDGDIREARALLGPSAQIGKTCHDSRHFAMEAGEAGADYVAFGAFYPTTTKPSHYRPDPSILTWWSTLFEIPCVAIGGINPDNAKPLVDAGADFLAVSRRCGARTIRRRGPRLRRGYGALTSHERSFAVPFGDDIFAAGFDRAAFVRGPRVGTAVQRHIVPDEHSPEEWLDRQVEIFEAVAPPSPG